MARVCTLGRMAKFMTENGVRALKRVLAFGKGKMEKATSANGRMDTFKEEAYIFGRTAISTKATG